MQDTQFDQKPSEVQQGAEKAGTGKNGKGKKPPKPLWREILEWILTIVVALAAALVIRTFLFEPVRVDGASMNDTLADGEVMYVSKTGYSSFWLSLPWASAEAQEASTKLTFFGNPARFDVVICRYPHRGGTNFVKRVVGLPGDRVSIRDGYLYVNGDRYEEPYINDEYRTGFYRNFDEVLVPKAGDTIRLTDSGMLLINGAEDTYGLTRVTAVSGSDTLVLTGSSAGIQAELNGKAVTLRSGVWYLDGEAQEGNPMDRDFTVSADYFFVMGDHRNNSNDSRMQGAIERSYVIGRVCQVLLPFRNWRGIPNGLDVQE